MLDDTHHGHLAAAILLIMPSMPCRHCSISSLFRYDQRSQLLYIMDYWHIHMGMLMYDGHRYF